MTRREARRRTAPAGPVGVPAPLEASPAEHPRGAVFGASGELAVFALVVGLTLAARAAALVPLSYSIDTYIEILNPAYHADNLGARLASGRFGQALLNEILTALGSSPPLTNVFYTLLCMLSLSWTGVVTARIWGLSADRLAALLVAATICLHPYQTELFTFNSTPIYTTTALLCGFGALYYSRSWRSLLWTAPCFAFALSCYQTIFNYAAVVVAFLLILSALRAPSEELRGWAARVVSSEWLAQRSAVVVLGSLLYYAANELVMAAFGVPPGPRLELLAVRDLPRRVDEARAAFWRIFVEPEPVMPGAVKLVIATAASIPLALAAWKCLAPASPSVRLVRLAAVAAGLAAGALGCIGLMLATQGWWAVPRILSATSFFVAGLVAIGATYARGPARWFLAVTCGIFLFAFIGLDNRILSDLQRVNLRDLSRANRIVARLESDPRFPEVRRVVMVGGTYAFASPIPTAHGDMNVSAFVAPWAKVPILNEVSGYAFGVPSTAEQQASAAHCAAAPRWPAPASITIAGDLAIVCH